MLKYLIHSKTKRKLLRQFLLNPESRFYVRELEKQLKEPINAVRRELSHLEKAGLLKVRREGNLKYYQVDQSCPIFPELKNILHLTLGVGESLKKALSDYSSVKLAFIYGSVARNEEDSKSDVDLMVVGEVDEISMHRIISGLEEELRREINYTVMSMTEFKRKLKAGDPFIKRIIKEPKLVLKGTLNEL